MKTARLMVTIGITVLLLTGFKLFHKILYQNDVAANCQFTVSY